MEEGKYLIKTISDSKTYIFLGANMQNSLVWQHHLETGPKAVLPAYRKQLEALYSLRDLLSQKAKLQLVNSLIISKLVYLIPQCHSKLPKISPLDVSLMTECNWMSMTRTYLVPFNNAHMKKYSVTKDYAISTTQPRLQLTAASNKWRMTNK